MNVWTWVEIGVLNALSATALALVAALVTWRVRRPGLVHAVWALVLLKLVSFPVLELNVEPLLAPLRAAVPGQTAARLGTSAIPNEATHEAAREVAPQTRPADSGRPEWVALPERGADASMRSKAYPSEWVGHVLIPAAAWTGAGALLVLWILRATRFRRRLRFTARSSPQLDARVRELSVSIGVRQPPHVRLIRERIPPSLLPWPGRCEILVPEALLQRLTDAELETLLLHELAHFRRRDHWMRGLELAAGALFWWHPVAWWARRNLRVAEEQCCDALVKRALPHRARAYAESLLKTVEFLSTQNASVPALATGAGESNRLKERVIMILDPNAPRSLPRWIRLPLLVLAVAAVCVSPAWVNRGADAAEPRKQPDVRLGITEPLDAAGQEAGPSAQDQERRELEARELRRLDLEREKLQLEREFAQLEFERQQVHGRLEAAEAEAEAKRLREELRQLEAEGRDEAAQALRQRLEILRHERSLREEQLQLEQRHMRQTMETEFELRHLEIELRVAELGTDAGRLKELQLRMHELQRRLQELELEALRDELLQGRKRLELERAKLKSADSER